MWKAIKRTWYEWQFWIILGALVIYFACLRILGTWGIVVGLLLGLAFIGSAYLAEERRIAKRQRQMTKNERGNRPM